MKCKTPWMGLPNTTSQNEKRIGEVELNLIKLSRIQYKEIKRI